MIEVSDERFQQLIDQALTELPGQHAASLKNVAILYEEKATPEQRVTAKLHPNQDLLGLYEGIPLSERHGMERMYPDKITLFRLPLSAQADTEDELKEAIKHTLWHEIAHYYGLDHDRIHQLE